LIKKIDDISSGERTAHIDKQKIELQMIDVKDRVGKLEAEIIGLSGELQSKSKKLIEQELQNSRLKINSNESNEVTIIKYDGMIDSLKGEREDLIILNKGMEITIQTLSLTNQDLERDKRVLESELITRNGEVKVLMSETQKLKFKNDD